jgi:N-methylhydantoinase A
LRARFHAMHDQFYGFHSESDPIEIVTLRLTASAAIARFGASNSKTRGSGRPEPAGYRPVWFARSRPRRTPVYHRAALRAGQRIDGPAIIEQLDSTTVLHPGDRLKVDDKLNLLVEVAT